MFEKKFQQAWALLDSIIPASYGGHGNGTNAQGKPYALVTNYDDNFNAATENNDEQVFQIQFSVNDGSDGGNENIGESANTPAFYPISSFYTTWKQPSFNLVNAFKTDADGLPMLDTFNVTNMTNDMAVAADDYTYSTYQGTVDPRLDWTVGRRGVPYLDWADPEYSTGFTYYSSYPTSDPSYGWINDRNFGGRSLFTREEQLPCKPGRYLQRFLRAGLPVGQRRQLQHHPLRRCIALGGGMCRGAE
jgi:hypothetical protein